MLPWLRHRAAPAQHHRPTSAQDAAESARTPQAAQTRRHRIWPHLVSPVCGGAADAAADAAAHIAGQVDTGDELTRRDDLADAAEKAADAAEQAQDAAEEATAAADGKNNTDGN